MPLKVTASEFVDKHARRLKGATEDIRRGVSRVTESPTEKAANAKEKMRAGINRAIDSGKWERGLRGVSLDDWKRKMLDVGVNRIATGIDAAAPKVLAFANKLLPHIEQGQAAIKDLPSLTFEDSLNRMTEWSRHMHTFDNQ